MSGGACRLVILDGLTRYDEAHALQLDVVEQRKRSEIPDTLILLEHTPVVTLGRNADEMGVVASADLLEARGIDMRRIERGGQVTYHGPGQIVGYPILNLHGLGIGVARYVAALEDMMILAARTLGVASDRKEGTTGVFSISVSGGKIGAIGVRVTRGVTYHGFAFNVDPDLSHYDFIVPCGMSDTPVTSIAAILGEAPPMKAARDAVIESFGSVFEMEFVSSGLVGS
jgi:lipoyl(octanoyl) transferase